MPPVTHLVIERDRWQPVRQRYIGDGKYEPRVYLVGDRLENPRFVNNPSYPHEKFTVTKVEGEFVFTRNDYSGSNGVMVAGFYDGWPLMRAVDTAEQNAADREGAK